MYVVSASRPSFTFRRIDHVFFKVTIEKAQASLLKAEKEAAKMLSNMKTSHKDMSEYKSMQKAYKEAYIKKACES